MNCYFLLLNIVIGSVTLLLLLINEWSNVIENYEELLLTIIISYHHFTNSITSYYNSTGSHRHYCYIKHFITFNNIVVNNIYCKRLHCYTSWNINCYKASIIILSSYIRKNMIITTNLSIIKYAYIHTYSSDICCTDHNFKLY